MAKNTITAQIKELADRIDEANQVVFFGGAGVSTESGVPDFRSKRGIYRQHAGTERILTPEYMNAHPEEFWTFYRKYFMLQGIKPNFAHVFLADLENEGKLKAIVTQNVDDLHRAAGSKNVIELHGNGTMFYCSRCSTRYGMQEVACLALVPRCDCGGRIRPDVVLYHESLNSRAIEQAIKAISECDLLIVGGTSLTVYPAAGFIQHQRKGKLVIINESATSGDGKADLVIQKPIGAVFAEVAAERRRRGDE